MNSIDDDERWADLADLVLSVAREIQFRETENDVNHSARVVRITPSEGNIMRFIDEHPGLSAGDVAHATGLRRSNLSAGLRVLEEKGLIERRENSDDARGIRIHPTELARRNLEIIRSEWSTLLRDAVAGDDSLLADATSLLARLDAGLIAGRQNPSIPRPTADPV